MTMTEKTDEIIITEGAATVAGRGLQAEYGEAQEIDAYLAELREETAFIEAAEREHGKPWDVLYEEGHRLPGDTE